MKRYTLSVTSPEYWSEIHDALIVDSNQDGIPDRKITCSDCKHHSPTRGTYELTETEATEIGNHPHVEWIELSPEDNHRNHRAWLGMSQQGSKVLHLLVAVQHKD